MEILEITNSSRLEWLSVCKECSYSTFFHTPYWVELFQKWSGGKISPCTKKVVFSDGKIAVLPLVQKSIFVNKVYLSMPASTYGGWVSPDILDEEHVTAIIKYLNVYKDFIIRENPYSPFPDSIGLNDITEDFTQVIELQGGYESVCKNAHSCHRKAVRNAVKSGLKILEAQDLKEYEIFGELYTNSITRWKNRGIFKGVNYTVENYRDIYNIEACYRKLFLAFHESTPIAGLLCFYWKKHVVAWHAAGLEKYFHLRPNNLLYDFALKDASLGGYEVFDLNPCSGLGGVEKFKEYLGAKKLRSRLVNRKSFLRKIALYLRHNHSKRVSKRIGKSQD